MRFGITLQRLSGNASSCKGLFLWLCATIAFVGSCGGAGESSDPSLTTEEYVALGVPSVEGGWSSNDYAIAMNVLSSLPRHELPRYQSSKSGRLFDQLLEAHLSLGEGIATTSAPAFMADTPLLPQLYESDEPGERADFAREIIAVRAASLQKIMDSFTSMRQTERDLAGVQQDLEHGTPSQLEFLRAEIAETRSFSSSLGGVIASQLVELVRLGRLPAVSADALRDLIAELRVVAPESSEFLSDEERHNVVHVLRATAGELSSKDLAAELHSISEHFQTARIDEP